MLKHRQESIGFPEGSDGKESACNAGDLGWTPRSGRPPGEGDDNPLQYTCLENPTDRGARRGYRPWGRTELDRTEQLTLSLSSPTGKYVPCLVITSQGKEFEGQIYVDCKYICRHVYLQPGVLQVQGLKKNQTRLSDGTTYIYIYAYIWGDV